MSIRSKSPAEISEQILTIEPNMVNFGGGSDISEAIRYKDIRNRYIGHITLRKDDPSEVNNAFAETVDEMQNGPTDLFTARANGYGFPAALKKLRRSQRQKFIESTSQFQETSQVDESTKENNRDELEANSLFLGKDFDPEKAKELFPGGNWLLHSATTDAILSILKDGVIRSTASLVREDRKNIDKSTGGSFGVSWNMNQLEVLLGDADHLAGFMVDPQVLLEAQGGILAVPQKSTFNEVQFFSAEPDDIYEIRGTENLKDAAFSLNLVYEALCASLAGQSGLMQVAGGNKKLADEISNKVQNIADSLASDDTDPDFLRKHYILSRTGEFRFSSLIGNLGMEGVQLVFLQAVADGAFGEESRKALGGKLPKEIKPEWVRSIQPAIERFNQGSEKIIGDVSKKFGNSSCVEAKNTIFYCSNMDYPAWLEVLSSLTDPPKGIVVYDKKDIRVATGFVDSGLENPGRATLEAQLSRLNDPQTMQDWDSFFVQGRPNRNKNSYYMVDRAEAAIAGVMVLEDDRIKIKSLDEIDDED